MTMTSAQPEGRFGALDIESDGHVSKFRKRNQKVMAIG